MRFALYTSLLFGLSCALTDYDLSKDTAPDCDQRVSRCRKDEDTFLECPITCAEALDGGLMVQGVAPREPEEYFSLYANYAKTGNRFNFDRLEDSVSMIAVLPLLPGMAQYYYELMEEMATENPFMISTVILPFKDSGNREMNQYNLDVFNHGKSIVLETFESNSMGSHPIVGYVESARRNQKTRDPLYNDRAIIFVVSADGKYVERRVCPTKQKLKGVIRHYLEHQLTDEA